MASIPVPTAKLIAAWENSGFGTRDVFARRGQAMACRLSTPESVRATLGGLTTITEVGFWAAGWDRELDVLVFQRAD